jgi:hypothetical protein
VNVPHFGLQIAINLWICRLQVTIAKIQQSLPEMKRDGYAVRGSIWIDLMHGENSTSRAGSLLSQLEFLPKLAKQLQEQPAEVVLAFEEIRKYCV